VTEDDTAQALGSGDVPVLATPRLVAWCEAATVAALSDLPVGQTSVGTLVRLEHLAASPVGARTEVTARLVEREGRLCRFEVTAVDATPGVPEATLLATGEVRRVVVDRERFTARAGVR
jgi:predicted thioesterase